jgi:hypothetical protein
VFDLSHVSPWLVPIEAEVAGPDGAELSRIDTGVLIAFDCFLPHLPTIDHNSFANSNFSFENGVIHA